MIVRISRGRFEPAAFDLIDRLLRESSAVLVPAIQRLDGNLRYYAGIDRVSGTMVNVSVWDTFDHAAQMADLPEMRALAQTFTAQGVVFELIVNYDTVWAIDG